MGEGFPTWRQRWTEGPGCVSWARLQPALSRAAPGGSAGLSTRSPALADPILGGGTASRCGCSDGEGPAQTAGNLLRMPPCGNPVESAASSRRDTRSGSPGCREAAPRASCIPCKVQALLPCRPVEHTGKQGGQTWELSKVRGRSRAPRPAAAGGPGQRPPRGPALAHAH